MNVPLTKLWHDEVERDIRSFQVGEASLYFYREAMIAAIDTKNSTIHVLKLPIRKGDSIPLMISHLPPGENRSGGLTPQIITTCVEDMGLNNPQIFAVDSDELQQTGMTLIGMECLRYVDEGLNLVHK